MKYVQCVLSKNISRKQVAFIPEKLARVGQKLKIKCDIGWDVGWIVDRASTILVDEENLPDSHKEIKSHRKSTGDNTPKVTK